jgi:hypothetical protein
VEITTDDLEQQAKFCVAGGNFVSHLPPAESEMSIVSRY